MLIYTNALQQTPSRKWAAVVPRIHLLVALLRDFRDSNPDPAANIGPWGGVAEALRRSANYAHVVAFTGNKRPRPTHKSQNACSRPRFEPLNLGSHGGMEASWTWQWTLARALAFVVPVDTSALQTDPQLHCTPRPVSLVLCDMRPGRTVTCSGW
jgi:hypothetical protein